MPSIRPWSRRAGRPVLVALAALVLLVIGAGRVRAQDGAGSPTQPPVAAPAPAPVAQRPVAPPQVASPPVALARGTVVYHSPMRPTCEDELAKDKDWFDNLKARLLDKINRDVHGDAARYATANNKHVIAAYAVFWLFTVGFVVLMWRRQRGLQAELGRLSRELERALEGGAGK